MNEIKMTMDDGVNFDRDSRMNGKPIGQIHTNLWYMGEE